jgi:redox-sensitive bicupin YhaK (pirin superfamily)
MIAIRPSEDRGRTRFGWLDSRHSFSFGDYRDPRHMGFRALRVINDDVIAAGQGFGTHPHRDMEILTFMQAGSLAHRDSMGNGSVIRPGDVQRMTAGTGVMHSEMNPSADEEARLLQVWIEPDTLGLEPSYEQRHFGDDWQLVASPDGRDGSITLHQDARVFTGRLEAGEQQLHRLAPGRHVWLHVIEGEVEAAGEKLGAGDAVAISDVSEVAIRASQESRVLLFDLA